MSAFDFIFDEGDWNFVAAGDNSSDAIQDKVNEIMVRTTDLMERVQLDPSISVSFGDFIGMDELEWVYLNGLGLEYMNFIAMQSSAILFSNYGSDYILPAEWVARIAVDFDIPYHVWASAVAVTNYHLHEGHRNTLAEPNLVEVDDIANGCIAVFLLFVDKVYEFARDVQTS